MTFPGTPLRRSARPGWYGSGCPTRARIGPSVFASWTAPSASASHSRGLASDEDQAGTRRLKRTLAPGSTSLARLSTSFRISAGQGGSDTRAALAGELPSGEIATELTHRSRPARVLHCSPVAGRWVRVLPGQTGGWCYTRAAWPRSPAPVGPIKSFMFSAGRCAAPRRCRRGGDAHGNPAADVVGARGKLVAAGGCIGPRTRQRLAWSGARQDDCPGSSACRTTPRAP
jgi:hypothetical protein